MNFQTLTEEEDEKETKDAAHKTPIFVLNREAEKAALEKPANPKLVRATPNYKLPSFPAPRGAPARSSMKTS